MEEEMMMLTLLTSINERRGLCGPLPQFYADLSSAQDPKCACTFNLKLPQFCCMGRHSFGKDTWCFHLTWCK